MTVQNNNKGLSINLKAPIYMICLIFWAVVFTPAIAQELPDQNQCRNLWQQQVRLKPEIAGWCLIIDQAKGNCIACHSLSNGSKPLPWPEKLYVAGNIAPILQSAPHQFSDRVALKQLIYDATNKFPNSNMPLYGKHKILEDQEIDLIVSYLMTLGI